MERRHQRPSLLRVFAAGLGAPGLLVSGPQIAPRVLHRGQTVRHAWTQVGRHLSQGMKRMADERRAGSDPA